MKLSKIALVLFVGATVHQTAIAQSTTTDGAKAKNVI